MREVISEYGAMILSVIATVAIVTIFFSLFNADGADYIRRVFIAYI